MKELLLLCFQQEELSRYDPERDLPYDPLQPSIRAPEERRVDEDAMDDASAIPPLVDKNVTTEYVPSRPHHISGTSLRHDPNLASSTIENLDDDDDEDDENVYDPNRPVIFQQAPPSNPPASQAEQSE
jgi:hypothetical protein